MEDEMRANDFLYRGEGNSSLVVLHRKEHCVLRIPKDQRKAQQKAEGCGGQKQQKQPDVIENFRFTQKVIRPKLGPHYVPQGTLVRASPKFLQELKALVQASRPVARCKQEVLLHCGTVLRYPDVCFLPAEITEPHSPTFCVEIKPKCGVLRSGNGASVGASVGACHFCMFQHVKSSQGKWPSISQYCPLDLFSGDMELMTEAIVGLFHTPQNNFRLFKDGELVYSEEQQHDFVPVIRPFFPTPPPCIQCSNPRQTTSTDSAKLQGSHSKKDETDGEELLNGDGRRTSSVRDTTKENGNGEALKSYRIGNDTELGHNGIRTRVGNTSRKDYDDDVEKNDDEGNATVQTTKECNDNDSSQNNSDMSVDMSLSSLQSQSNSKAVQRCLSVQKQTRQKSSSRCSQCVGRLCSSSVKVEENGNMASNSGEMGGENGVQSKQNGKTNGTGNVNGMNGQNQMGVIGENGMNGLNGNQVNGKSNNDSGSIDYSSNCVGQKKSGMKRNGCDSDSIHEAKYPKIADDCSMNGSQEHHENSSKTPRICENGSTGLAQNPAYSNVSDIDDTQISSSQKYTDDRIKVEFAQFLAKCLLKGFEEEKGEGKEELDEEMPGLSSSCVLGRILKLQQQDRTGISSLKDEYQRIKRFLSGSEDEGKAFDRLQYEDLPQGNITDPQLEEAVRKVGDFLESHTAKDCSIMLAFQPLGPALKFRGATKDVVEFGGRVYRVNINVIDLDRKGFNRIEKYFKLEREITQHYRNVLNQQGKQPQKA